MTVHHFSLFADSGSPHGGTKRSEQLKSISRSLGIETTTLYPRRIAVLRQILPHPAATVRVLWFGILGLFRGLSPKGFLRYVIHGLHVLVTIGKSRARLVLLEVGANEGILMMDLLGRVGMPFVTFPHNIEFLVPGQLQDSFISQGVAYSWEVKGYRNAIRNFTISSLDAAVVAAKGGSSSVLSFFPSPSELARFERIRATRRFGPSSDGGYLILGSVLNAPSRDGMSRLLEQLESTDLGATAFVAGMGTEVFSSRASEKVQVLGTLSATELDAQLTKCRAVLINQPPTSGFLTRLVEMNLCGVPVIVVSEYFQAQGLEELGIYCSNLRKVGHVDTTVERRFTPPDVLDVRELIESLSAEPD